jgi:hypothetical protein
VDADGFTVPDFDKDAKTVKLRNPGGKHPEPGGNFTLSLAAFLQGFSSCSMSD